MHPCPCPYLTRFSLVLSLAASLAALPACGDDDDDGDDDAPDAALADGGDGIDAGTIDAGSADAAVELCKGSFTACGGDVVGRWSFVDYCGVAGNFPPVECEGETFSFTYQTSGFVDFDNQGNYERNLMLAVDATRFRPAACLPDSTAACSDLDGDGFTCTGDAATSCTCDGTTTLEEVSDGTYTAENDLLTFDVGKGADVAAYCVDGDLLYIHPEGEDEDLIVLHRNGASLH
jgi:hypothetical protein